jgi:alpha-tubulin suppressor-like RCC1 family protein
MINILDEIIIKIALYLNVTNLSLTCHRFNNLTFNNDYFWYLKFIHDFEPLSFKPKSWKEIYKTYGTTFCCGNGERGQLSINSTDDKDKLTQIEKRPKFVFSGGYQTVIIDNNDQAWLLKYTHCLKLGKFKAKSIACGRDYTAIIDIENNVHVFEDNSPMNLNIHIKAKSVSCGDYHMIFIDLDNYVWVLGNDNDGQLGLGDNLNRTSFTRLSWDNVSKALAVSCGKSHSIILDINHKIWSFGFNSNGQLGLGDRINRSIPCLVSFSVGQDILFPFPWDNISYPAEKIKMISCGAFHSLIIDCDNNLWSFGYNGCGQLGLNDMIDRLVPTLIPLFTAKRIFAGHSHSIIQGFNDNIWSFGQNRYGQLGLGDTINRNIPTLISLNDKNVQIKDVACGYYHTVIIALCIS